MVNYKARKSLVLLDNHVATGTEATYTYTPSPALDMKLTYRQLIIVITGKATAALQLQLKINSSTDYNESFIQKDVATLTGGVNDAASTYDLIDSALLDGAVTFQGEAKIACNDAADLITISSNFVATHEGNFINQGEVQGAATTISSIEILVSTSTWIAGTEISIYGLSR